MNAEPSPPKTLIVRDYKNINIEQLKEDFQSTPWQLIELFDDVNDALWCWEQLFKRVITDHIKTRKIKVKSNNQPWMTGDMRKVLNKRYKLFQKAKLGNDPLLWKAYKQMRNTCTHLIRKSKAEYWKNEFQNCSNTKTFWKTVRKFKGDTKTSTVSSLMSMIQLSPIKNKWPTP